MTEHRFHVGRWIAAVLAVIALVGVFYQVVVDNMPKGEVRVVEGYTPWSEQTVEVAETLAVQDGGRIKPLATFAGFTMLRIHGARSMKIDTQGSGKVTIKPVPWMLDLLFRPKFAIQQPTFRIDNSVVLDAIGVPSRAKRDRYSYADIEPGRLKLAELADVYGRMEAEKRDPMQNQILDLATNMRAYEELLGYFNFARFGVEAKGASKDGGEDQRFDLSAMMVASKEPDVRQQIDRAARGEEVDPNLRNLLEQVEGASAMASASLMVLPAKNPAEKAWKSAGEAIMEVMQGSAKEPDRSINDIAMLESLARSATASEGDFRGELQAFITETTKRATDRGEAKHIGLEATYYRKNWFLYALVFFLLGSVSALGMGAFGPSIVGKGFFGVTLASCVAGLVYCVTAITMRCVIMGRPPIGNLYDTVIFIATAVVAISLVIEWLVRRKFALGLAPVMGAILIVLARRFELGDAKDHMDPLVAVLNSNYWLTTHVITITLGYSAGLLGAFLSTGYILMRGLGLDGGDQAVRRSLTRVVYGMLCFTSFLALVGTVLGGIWANDSWGRFWGWDPKENGALLIVLWTLAILHARLGGFLREWGLHLASVFTAIVVTFSWWHVNFLGVGLHNYGFTAGKGTITRFYIAMAVVILFGATAMIIEKCRTSTGKT